MNTASSNLSFLPNGEDPDSLIRTQGREAFDGFLNNATPGIEFLLKRLADGLDLGSLDGRAKFMGVANPYVEKMSKRYFEGLSGRSCARDERYGCTSGGAPRATKPRSQTKRGEAALSERLPGSW